MFGWFNSDSILCSLWRWKHSGECFPFSLWTIIFKTFSSAWPDEFISEYMCELFDLPILRSEETFYFNIDSILLFQLYLKI